MGWDDISMRSIKQAQKELQPLILHLLNKTILTTTFPNLLKIAKVIPIEKAGKDRTTAEGWHPVNILPALSKIAERVYLDQMSRHMEVNNFIGPNHHGAIKRKSTQTLILELHDKIIEDSTNGIESVLMIIDQSKAYEVVPHDLLLKKLSILGFQPQSLKLLASVRYRPR